MSKIETFKNVPNWVANERDYQLVFVPTHNIVTNIFEYREAGHDIPKYRNILLADYLLDIGVCVPDFTQFLRVITEDFRFEYRAYNNARIRIDVKYFDNELA